MGGGESAAPHAAVSHATGLDALAGGARAVVAGLLVNAGLALVKLFSGLLGQSYALVADAVESMADIFGSLVVWSGLRISARPADDDHPYGHGKAEALAAMIVAMMLLGAGIGIAIEAVREIVTPHHAPAPFTLVVLIVVVIVKETLYRGVRIASRRAGSNAVLADAWHHRSDAITSLAAGVGITVALVGGPGFEPADDWAALVASAVILYTAGRLLRAPVHELMDGDAPHVAASARRIALTIPGIRGVEKVFSRKLGVEYWVDMHIEVDPDMPVRQAHGLGHEVEDAIRAQLANVRRVSTHVEPYPHKPAGG